VAGPPSGPECVKQVCDSPERAAAPYMHAEVASWVPPEESVIPHTSTKGAFAAKAWTLVPGFTAGHGACGLPPSPPASHAVGVRANDRRLIPTASAVASSAVPVVQAAAAAGAQTPGC
jgi:hypothetical protein